ncbi:MAG: glycosyl transferase [Clostridia bacterium]|nr:glycosyl transferase [Clostridia bacterium]
MSLKKYFKDPKKYAIMLYGRLMPDTVACNAKYLKKVYRHNTGKELDLDDPKTYNEKLQWLKLYDRRPEYTDMVDKCEAKKYVAGRVGEEYIIPTYGVWNTFDEVDFDSLPDQFVLKCTHDSGGLIICRDKSALDREAARKIIEHSLSRNYYRSGIEWPYKNVKPRIIAEELLSDGNSGGIADYKFFCFGGEPKFMYVSRGLENHATAQISFFDLKGQRLPYERRDYRPIDTFTPPENLEKMVELAGKMASGIASPFVRIDLYSVDGKIYFSEITFFPCSGMIPFRNPEHDAEIGEMLDLSSVRNGNNAIKEKVL